MNSNDSEYLFNEELSNAELVNNDSFLKLRTKNKRKEVGRKIFYVVIGAALTALIAVVCIVVFFGLKKVEIRGNSRYTEKQILDACGFSPSDNLFGVDLKKAERNIIKKYPYISKVTFKRVLPSTLIVSVTEDAPSYCAEIYGDYFLLSEDLRIISKHDIYEDIEVLDMPVIYLKLPQVERAVQGERIVFDKNSNYDHLIEFLSELREQEIYDRTDCIDATDRYHIALYTDGGKYKIVVGTLDNLDTKLKFVKNVIATYDPYAIVSINVEKVNQIVARVMDEQFEYR
ncbi:MAG: FtsQ-type POTRA domain-containing protein [Ruminococcaceae bacterium]|nr:FtsQ-type POTRA domain-containing protein [Oscillospiraceae bacterium]